MTAPPRRKKELWGNFLTSRTTIKKKNTYMMGKKRGQWKNRLGGDGIKGIEGETDHVWGEKKSEKGASFRDSIIGEKRTGATGMRQTTRFPRLWKKRSPSLSSSRS